MDDELRRLERAARESPRDALRGWAYVEALRRSGETQRVDRELARLARIGDVAAADALARRAPRAAAGPGRTWRARRVGLRRATGSRAAVHEIERPDLDGILATDELALIAHESGITAIELRTLTIRWSLPTPPRPRLLHLHGGEVVVFEAGRLTRRRVVDGAAVAHVPGPPFATVWVSGDRAVGRLAHDPSTDVVTAVSLADENLGGVVWMRELGGARVSAFVDGRLILRGAGRFVAIDAETGDEQWTRHDADPSEPGAADEPWGLAPDGRPVYSSDRLGRAASAPGDAWLGDLDEAGAALVQRAGDGRLTITELALDDAGARTCLEASDESVEVALGVERLVALVKGEGLIGVERGGKELWRVEVPLVGTGRPCLALADDVVYASGSLARAPILAVDVASGEELGGIDLPAMVPTSSIWGGLRVLPLDGALVVIVQSGFDVWVARIDGETAADG